MKKCYLHSHKQEKGELLLETITNFRQLVIFRVQEISNLLWDSKAILKWLASKLKALYQMI